MLIGKKENMVVKSIVAQIKGQNFVLTYSEEEEEWIKEFCGCVIKNNTLVEKAHAKKKGNKNVSKTRKQIQ
jgi:hypothetical protein